MARKRRYLFLVWSAALIVAGAAVLFMVFSSWKAGAISPAEKGREVAERLGCFGCHGPGGTKGISNPGDPDGTVPSWDGGTIMMYANSEGEIREWILDGMAARLKSQPAAIEKRKKFLIRMPAYRKWVGGKDLDNLVSFVKAVSWYPETGDEAAKKGMEEAQEHGCFGCHGPSGRGSLSNPGSFKGVIPGWDGTDFSELVKNDQELTEWIREGISKRMRDNPLASRFLFGQAITMPAFKNVLDDDDIKDITAYIHWLRK